MGQPFRLCDYYGRYLLMEQQWILADKLAEVPCNYDSYAAASHR